MVVPVVVLLMRRRKSLRPGDISVFEVAMTASQWMHIENTENNYNRQLSLARSWFE